MFSLKPAFPRYSSHGDLALLMRGVWISLLNITTNNSTRILQAFSLIIFPQSSPPYTLQCLDQDNLKSHCCSVCVASEYSSSLVQLPFPLNVFLWTFSWIGTPAVNIFVNLLERTPAIWSLWSPYLPQCYPPLPSPHPPTTPLHSFCFHSTASEGLLGTRELWIQTLPFSSHLLQELSSLLSMVVIPSASFYCKCTHTYTHAFTFYFFSRSLLLIISLRDTLNMILAVALENL